MEGVPLGRSCGHDRPGIDPRAHRALLGIGQVFGARRPIDRLAAVRVMRLGLGQTGNLAEHRVKLPRRRCGCRPGRVRVCAQLIEPRQMRQQQPGIEPPPHRDQLAPVIDRLLHPFQRALGQHRLGMIARQHQRRQPPGRKPRIAPPRQVQGRAVHPHPRRRHPDIAVTGQRIQKPHLALGREDRIGTRSPRIFRGGGVGVVAVPGELGLVQATTPRPPPVKMRGSGSANASDHLTPLHPCPLILSLPKKLGAAAIRIVLGHGGNSGLGGGNRRG